MEELREKERFDLAEKERGDFEAKDEYYKLKYPKPAKVVDEEEEEEDIDPAN